MNPQTGDLYMTEEEVRAALARGEKLVEVSPDVARLIVDGRTYQRQQARRRAKAKRARASRKRNR